MVRMMDRNSSIPNHSPRIISFSESHLFFTPYPVYPVGVNDIALVEPEILRA